ncbi:MAG: hypothetical protein PWP60_892 [Candidatus Atribacteria bacterium]|nr:hypothetical protein [Candidatus Atribacteria bacterium]MDI3531043.1 hypothetical protein [Candidatus Atribacteria bacterium]
MKKPEELTRKLFTILGILQALILLVAMGCQSSVILGQPDIVGLIEDFQEGADVYHCSILVKEEASSSSLYDLAWVRINGSTAIIRNGTEVEGTACLFLEEGMRVRVWFEGPVMESYPVQGYAKRIEIMD